MDMQNVAKLNIPEGEVRTIHDKDGNLIWGKVSYGVKYKGETSQQTYTGKNLVYTSGKTDGGITATYNTATGETTISGTAQRTYAVFGTNASSLPAGTYTFSIQSTAPAAVGIGTRVDGGSRVARPISVGSTKTTFTISGTMTGYDIYLTGLTVGTYYEFSFKAMLEAGNTATSFEPYVGGVPAPNPDYPQAVQTVTGENVVKISDGQGNEQSYSISLGSIELCKIGDYQDYIYKSGGKWYVHKAIGKYVYNNDLTGNGTSSTLVAMLTPALPIAPNLSALDGVAVSNMYGTISTDITKLGGTTSVSCIRVNTSIDIADSYNAVKALAAANNLTIYYALATPTDTEITNTALIAQLEAVEQWLTRYGYNATVSGNLPIIIDRTAL